MIEDEGDLGLEKSKAIKATKPSYVYLLESTKGNTYIGATIDLNRRLRQHNKEIKGGARATGIKVETGETWRRVCYVKGFPDWTATLQFEWRWKQISRKLPIKMKPVIRRAAALKQILELEKPTTKSVPYSEWTCKPEICVEQEEDHHLFIFS